MKFTNRNRKLASAIFVVQIISGQLDRVRVNSAYNCCKLCIAKERKKARNFLILYESHFHQIRSNLTFTGLEDLHISGSTRGSLSALKKWY